MTNEEIRVVHRRRQPLPARYPLPELGVHLAGPRKLAASDRASFALRAVYGVTWGLEVEVMAVRFKWESSGSPDGPVHGLSVALAASEKDLAFYGLGHGPETENAPWRVTGGGGDGQIEHQFVLVSLLAFQPYPETGTLWLGWSWPELGLAQGTVSLSLPEASSFAPIPMMASE